MVLRVTITLLGCGVFLLESSGHAASASKHRPPKIIFILADDLGWSELGCYSNRFNETPNLDRMAGQGMRFTQAYAAAPVCSPTRATFLTGRTPASLGLTDYLKPDDANFLAPTVPTLAKHLTQAGYPCGLVGKWHLNGDYARQRGTPAQHGFDEVICSEQAGIQPGQVCDVPIITHDFYPTILEAADMRTQRKEKVEGLSLLPLFRGVSSLKRKALYWHYPLSKPHFLGGSSASAIRKGDFKLIEFLDSGKVELYDLRNDLSETHDLSAAMPKKTLELRKLLAEWRQKAGHEKAQEAQK